MKYLLILVCLTQIYAKSAVEPKPYGFEVNSGIVLTNDLGERQDLKTIFKSHTYHFIQFVYFNCGSICSPFINETIFALQSIQKDFPVGESFALHSVSINPHEGADLAMQKRKNYLKELHSIELSPKASDDGWRFYVGDSLNIAKLTEELGFYYDKIGDKDYNHKAVLILMDSQGRVLNYIHGPMLYPTELKLALWEAQGGFVNQVKQSWIQGFYVKNSVKARYEISTMRVILASLAILGCFLALFSLLRFSLISRNSKSLTHKSTSSNEANQ